MSYTNEKTITFLDKEAMHDIAQKIARDKMKEIPNFSQEEAKKIFLDLKVNQIELEMQNEELREAQTKLYEAKERYFYLYEMAPVCYCTLNEEGLITESNLTASRLLGYEKSELYMKPISDFIFHKDQDAYYLNRNKFKNSDKPISCEVRMVKGDGSVCWSLIWATMHITINNEKNIRLVLTDISEQKMMQEQLEQKKKMLLLQSRYATMGEMISMIAHQWRQPLNIIGLAVANIQTKQALNILDEKTIAENTVLIADNVNFMSNTIDDFRNYFKPNAPKEPTKVDEVVNIVFAVIGINLENKNISFNVENLSTSSLLIYKNSLVQVLINIISNAKDALLSNNVTPAVINVIVTETQESIVLSICDNAGGIPEDIINRIGEPYFSTKALTGTGLGLYISRTIVEKHLFGTLTWHNESGGACFVITLKKEESAK